MPVGRTRSGRRFARRIASLAGQRAARREEKAVAKFGGDAVSKLGLHELCVCCLGRKLLPVHCCEVHTICYQCLVLLGHNTRPDPDTMTRSSRRPTFESIVCCPICRRQGKIRMSESGLRGPWRLSRTAQLLVLPSKARRRWVCPHTDCHYYSHSSRDLMDHVQECRLATVKCPKCNHVLLRALYEEHFYLRCRKHTSLCSCSGSRGEFVQGTFNYIQQHAQWHRHLAQLRALALEVVEMTARPEDFMEIGRENKDDEWSLDEHGLRYTERMLSEFLVHYGWGNVTSEQVRRVIDPVPFLELADHASREFDGNMGIGPRYTASVVDSIIGVGRSNPLDWQLDDEGAVGNAAAAT